MRHEAPGVRARVWRPTDDRVELLTELTVLADEPSRHDVFVKRAATAVAEHVRGACVIALHQGPSSVLSLASHVVRGRTMAARAFSWFPGLAQDVLVAGGARLVRSADVAHQPLPARFLREGECHGDHALVVPVTIRGRVMGALGVMPEAFGTADDVRFLAEVSSRVAIVAEYLRLGEDAAGDGAREAPSPAPDLTNREREVLTCIADGMTSREAAAQLFISRRTVEWHRGRIQEKLGVAGRVALTRAARDAGLAG